MRVHLLAVLAIASASALALAGVLLAAQGERRAPPEPQLIDGPSLDFLPGSEPIRFSDPEGDATDSGAGDPATQAGCAPSSSTGSCAEPPADPPAHPPAGPKAPPFDVVEAGVEGETADALVLSLSLARLEVGFSGLAAPDGVDRTAQYALCWAPLPGSPCDHRVVLDVDVRGAQTHATAAFEVRSAACNEWALCAWGVPVDVRFGAPASITWSVPKALLGAAGAPLAIHHLQATTGWLQEPENLAAWHPTFTLNAPLRHLGARSAVLAVAGICDITERFRVDVVLQPAAAFGYPAIGGPLLVGTAQAESGSGPRAADELDLLAFDLVEDGPDLVATFTVAHLTGAPAFDFDYHVALGIGAQVWEIGWRQSGDHGPHGYAGRCIRTACEDGRVMTPHVELLAGTPGHVLVRAPSAFFGAPPAGTVTNLLWATTTYLEHNLVVGSYADPLYAGASSEYEVDTLRRGLAPFVFGSRGPG